VKIYSADVSGPPTFLDDAGAWQCLGCNIATNPAVGRRSAGAAACHHVNGGNRRRTGVVPPTLITQSFLWKTTSRTWKVVRQNAAIRPCRCRHDRLGLPLPGTLRQTSLQGEKRPHFRMRPFLCVLSLLVWNSPVTNTRACVSTREQELASESGQKKRGRFFFDRPLNSPGQSLLYQSENNRSTASAHGPHAFANPVPPSAQQAGPRAGSNIFARIAPYRPARSTAHAARRDLPFIVPAYSVRIRGKRRPIDSTHPH